MSVAETAHFFPNLRSGKTGIIVLAKERAAPTIKIIENRNGEKREFDPLYIAFRPDRNSIASQQRVMGLLDKPDITTVTIIEKCLNSLILGERQALNDAITEQVHTDLLKRRLVAVQACKAELSAKP